MDLFKLLTRSTNIQKSAHPSRPTTDRQVPSAGISSNPELRFENGHRLRIQGGSISRGVKRKRGAAEEEHSFDAPATPDISHHGEETGVQQHVSVENHALAADGQQNVDQHTRSAEAMATALSEEECWETLKRHKLKVTVLDTTKELRNRKSAAVPSSKVIGVNKKGVRKQLLPQPLTSFSLLRSKYGISRRLAENLRAQGYTRPTEVQMGSLPLLLGSDEDRGLAKKGVKRSRRHSRDEADLLTVAPTGSGKTLGFMIPVINGLLEDQRARKRMNPGGKFEHQVEALIVAPTHELADQIVNEGRKVALGTSIRISGLKKGMKLHSELLKNDLQDHEVVTDSEPGSSTKTSLVKADILVSTPLLLLHAISGKEPASNLLPSVRFLVLDEADVLLDPLFREQTVGIWDACSNPSLRISFWSATIGSSIEALAQSLIMDRRRKLGLKSKHHHIIRLVVGLKDSAIPNISHRLLYAASEQGKLLALRQLLHPSAAPTKDAPSLQPPFLIFTQTIPRAVALHSELLYDIPLEAGGSSRIAVLHSDLSDTARSNIMAGFRKGEIWILITTDLLSRGVDFRGINGVVNYDIPNTGVSYVHRVGRTGRQGREGGVAVTLYTKEDIQYVKNIANVIAASEGARRKAGSTGGENQGMQKWLLYVLPKVSKKAKKELKSKGVESRRVNAGNEKGSGPRTMRISTKSGYDRRLENNRKGAVTGSQRRRERDVMEDVESETDEWGGIDD